jgi:hypothetical protein
MIARRLGTTSAGFYEGIQGYSKPDKTKIADTLMPHFESILSTLKRETWSDFTRDELDSIVMMSSLPRNEKLALLSKE